MSEPRPPAPALLVLGTLHTDEAALAAALTGCRQRFGPTAEQLGPLSWEWSRYYEPEMGPGISRSFFIFERPVDPGDLAGIKLFTNSLERDHLQGCGGRAVNLDPGLLTMFNLVLATAKPRHQRIYLAKGIYGDLTLTYHTAAFQPQPWSYPDWAAPETLALLAQGRERLKRVLQGAA